MAANPADLPIPRASPTSGTVRGRFERMPDKTISLDMEKGESWAKDVRTGKQGVMLDEMPKLLSVLGLKVVSIERICITPDQKRRYDALEVIAAQALNPPKLTFDEPE